MNRVTLIVGVVACAAASIACCMVPATHEGTISQNTQEAVILHHDGREELVLRIGYRLEGEELPDNFAWVITVPAEPDAYEVADPALFGDMFRLSERLLRRPTKSDREARPLGTGTAEEPVAEGVELGRRVAVGPYDIQPVRGVGPNALEGLNAWLADNGFPTEDPDHMRYFVANGFTFLAIKVLTAEDEDTVARSAKLPPLHLSFASEHPYYPLRFSSRQGEFDVNLYVLTRDELDIEANLSMLDQMRWSNRASHRNNVAVGHDALPETLRAVIDATEHIAAAGEWHFNHFMCDRPNRGGTTIAQWDRDVFFDGSSLARLHRSDD